MFGIPGSRVVRVGVSPSSLQLENWENTRISQLTDFTIYFCDSKKLIDELSLKSSVISSTSCRPWEL